MPSRMSQADELDVQESMPVMAEQDNDSITFGQLLEKDGPEDNGMVFDIEDPTPNALSRRTPGADQTYHDRGWAYAFKLNVAVTVLAAFCFGGLALEAISSDLEFGEWRHRRLSEAPHTSGWLAALLMVLGLIALACTFAVGTLHCLIHCGKAVVWSVVVSAAIAWISLTVSFARNGLVLLTIVFAFIFGIAARFFYGQGARLHFSAANLKVAAVAVKSMPGTIFTSLYMSGLQLVWCLLCFIAALGSFAYLETVTGSDGLMHRAVYCWPRTVYVAPGEPSSGCFCLDEKISDDACEYKGWGLPLTLVWLVSMIWGCEVMKNVVTSTVSGSVAAWWFSPNDSTPVKGAFYRARHYSFGALCKASVVLGVASIFLGIAELVLRMVPVVNCIYGCTKFAIFDTFQYISTFVGIYGLNFKGAVSRVRELIKKRGATLVGNALIITCSTAFLMVISLFVYVIICSVLLGSTMALGGPSFHLFTLFAFGYIAFLFTALTVLEVVLAGVKAIFVCFLQYPEILKETHGRGLYDELNAAWMEMHPEDDRRNLGASAARQLNRAHDQTL